MSTPPQSYDNTRRYNTGEIVSFEGKIYKLKNTIGAAGYSPTSHPIYWELESTSPAPTFPSSAQSYDNTRRYSEGETVSFEGKIYELKNTIGAAGYSPSSHPNFWLLSTNPAPASPAPTTALPATPSSAESYDNSRKYNKGEIVSFEGKTYKLKEYIGAAGFGPTSHPKYWELVSTSPVTTSPAPTTPSFVKLYDNSRIYNKGELVSFEGNTYKFKEFTNGPGYGPTSHPNYWEKLGPISSFIFSSNPKIAEFIKAHISFMSIFAEIEDNVPPFNIYGEEGATHSNDKWNDLYAKAKNIKDDKDLYPGTLSCVYDIFFYYIASLINKSQIGNNNLVNFILINMFSTYLFATIRDKTPDKVLIVNMSDPTQTLISSYMIMVDAYHRLFDDDHLNRMPYVYPVGGLRLLIGKCAKRLLTEDPLTPANPTDLIDISNRTVNKTSSGGSRSRSKRRISTRRLTSTRRRI